MPAEIYDEILKSFRLHLPQTIRSALSVLAGALRDSLGAEACILVLPAERTVYTTGGAKGADEAIPASVEGLAEARSYRWIPVGGAGSTAAHENWSNPESFIKVPLYGGRERFGIFCLAARGNGRFDRISAEQKETISELLSALIYPFAVKGRARSGENGGEKIKIELLEATGDEFTMRRVLERMMELSQAELCAFYTEGDESSLDIMLDGRELSPRVKEIREKLETSYRMFTNRTSARNVTREKIYYRRKEQSIGYLLGRTKIESYFIVPVMFGSRVRGVLYVGSIRKDAFVRENIGLFRKLASEGDERTPLVYSVGGENSILERILTALPSGGALISREGRIICANAGFEDALQTSGSGPETVQELSRISPFNLLGVWEEFRVLKKNLVDRELRDKELSTRSLSITWLEMPGLSEDIGSLLLVRDITSAREREELREEMLAVVAHELRTPMTALKNSLQILKEGATSRSAGEGNDENGEYRFLETALRTAGRLSTLVDGLVNVSSVRMPDRLIAPTKVDIESFLDEASVLFVRPLEKKEIGFSIRVDDNARSAMFDRDRMEQVIQNLISNSIKNVPAGGRISITVSMPDEHHDDAFPAVPWEYLPPARFVDICIRDSGTGIPSEVAMRLSPSGGIPITNSPLKGLGLYIANRLMQAHGGALVIESGEGGGVHLYIPTDPETGRSIQALRLIESKIAGYISRGMKPTLYAMIKDAPRCWLEIAGSWKTPPVVNPDKSEIKDGGMYLWPLGERFAMALTTEERFAGSPLSFVQSGRGGLRMVNGNGGDSIRIGWATGPREGKSCSELLSAALERVSAGQAVTAMKGEMG